MEIVQWVLLNWKECGFRKPVIVKKMADTFYTTDAIDGYHSIGTAQYLKDKIRSENSIKGITPRFRWIKIVE